MAFILSIHVHAIHRSKSPDTPTWAKGVIFGALAYFVSPTDAIPDVTPGVGFTDDLCVLIGAVSAVAAHITPEIKDQADKKMAEWFD